MRVPATMAEAVKVAAAMECVEPSEWLRRAIADRLHDVSRAGIMLPGGTWLLGNPRPPRHVVEAKRGRMVT
ncbi:MAG: hypothetical protein OXP70_14220 [Acidobacteriota bacterium]|nr:hypothetical protein [Acidobacteriota bacterium]